MTVRHLHELADDGGQVVPLTVKQYHQMIEAGILREGEPYELLDGLLIRKDRSAAGAAPDSVGNEHAVAVTLLNELFPKLERLGCHVRIQQPISLPPHDEPEPDGAVVIGLPGDYRTHHPGPGDVTCVIEVADSSLQRDRNTKSRIYASAAIPAYVVVNLIDGVVERYNRPSPKKGRFEQKVVLQAADRIELPAGVGKILKVAVRSLLP
jgi:Uma2 family endonuclease